LEDEISHLCRSCEIDANFVIVKNHYFCHYVPFCVFFEEPEVSSTQAGEMAHKKKVKTHYAKSNRKNAGGFVSENFRKFLQIGFANQYSLLDG